MTQFHAVMLDETRCEFGVTFEAPSRDAAYDYLDENYPESRVDELKTSEEWDEKRRDMEARIWAEMDGDYSFEEDY